MDRPLSSDPDDPRGARIAELIAALRPGAVVKIFGGHSDGTSCTLCGGRMPVGSVDYELVVDGDVRARVDRECLQLWITAAGDRSK